MSNRDTSVKPSLLGQLLARSPRLASRGVSWQTWRDVVGLRVARRSHPGGLSGTTLFVVVTSSAWAQELSFLSRNIVERLSALGHPVASLRFQVGKVELPARAPAPARVEKAPLSQELQTRLSELDDPELCRLIAEAASYRRG
jgi:predicted nucleic acid-binding Zn ribbon protein